MVVILTCIFTIEDMNLIQIKSVVWFGFKMEKPLLDLDDGGYHEHHTGKLPVDRRILKMAIKWLHYITE